MSLIKRWCLFGFLLDNVLGLFIREGVRHRGQAQKQDVPLVLFGLTEHVVGAVKTVQDA